MAAHKDSLLSRSEDPQQQKDATHRHKVSMRNAVSECLEALSVSGRLPRFKGIVAEATL